MSSVDKLIKFLQSSNMTEFLEDDEAKEIADDVVVGYEIDEDSRKDWLRINKDAVKIIKNAENSQDDVDKEFPFHKSSKVIYPLLAPAVIQLASRMIQHLVRNNKVAECAILGKDQPEINPVNGKPTGFGIKESKAKRVSDFLSFEFLIDSDTWLLDKHKLCHILSSWGTVFEEVYYDAVTKKNCTELLNPEDVIVNHNISCMEKCRRVTIRLYMSQNDIIEQIRSGRFKDIELDQLDSSVMDNSKMMNDSREVQPVYEILKQYCWYDLDEDDYAEPYIVYVHKSSKTLLGIYPAYELKDINTDNKGKVLSIKFCPPVIDFHLIDDPEGKFYSLGLNHLLLHQNKGITSVLRQLIDAGTLANTAASSGFITKAFKTKERSLRFKLGEFKVLETPPGMDINSQIMNLPFKEPSQVLLALLQFLVESGKEMGFMTDVLTGEAETQNVPATTMLAMVEQGTRAFKPIVQKLYQSLKREFKLWFHLHSLYLDEARYFKFQDTQGVIQRSDFDEDNLDIMPVADPTMCSEAHKYAQLQSYIQLAQTPLIQATNVQEGLLRYFTGLEYPSPELMIAPPQPPQPDPKLVEIQAKTQIAQKDQEIEQLKNQIALMKVAVDDRKVDVKQQEVAIKAHQAKVGSLKTVVDAHKESMDVINQSKMLGIEQQNADTESRRVNVLEKQSNNKSDSTGS